MLIITNRDDLAVDVLLSRIEEEGLSAFRLNTEDLHLAKLNWNEKGEGSVEVGERELLLQHVSAVLYRRALTPLLAKLEVQLDARVFAAGEIRHTYEGILQSLATATWVNPLHATHAAERKLFQLTTARALGLRTPDTIVTNIAREASAFFARHPTGIISKPVFHGLWGAQNGFRAVYTRLLEPSGLPEQRELDSCPVLLQEAVNKRRDIRLTIIGQEAFTAAIDTEPVCSIDWRHPGHQPKYEEVEPPAQVLAASQQMLTTLSLNYGAFDFVETKDGDWTFLEVNPVGEWAWLERELGFRMTEAFLRLLFPGLWS